MDFTIESRPSSSSSLPSLTHFTLRSSSPSSNMLGPEPLLSLHSFFATHGSIRCLDLRFWPGETPAPITFLGDPVAQQGSVSVSAILTQCPNLTDLILSARWFALHTSFTTFPHFTAGTAGNNNNNATTHISPFSIPHHSNLEYEIHLHEQMVIRQ